MTWHALGIDMTGNIVSDTPFPSLMAAEQYVNQQYMGNDMLYRTYHDAHHVSCECLDCGAGCSRPPWLDRFEAVLAVAVFFLIGFLSGYALS